MISISKHSETVGIKNSQQKQAHGWTDIYCRVKGKKNRKERYMHSEITNNNNDHQQATEERGHIFCFVLMILMFIHSLLLCSLFSASLHRQRSPCLPLTNHLLQFTHLNTRPTERFLQCVLDLPWGLFLVVYAQNTFTQEGLKSHPVRWPNHLSCLLSMWLSSGAALSLS